MCGGRDRGCGGFEEPGVPSGGARARGGWQEEFRGQCSLAVDAMEWAVRWMTMKDCQKLRPPEGRKDRPLLVERYGRSRRIGMESLYRRSRRSTKLVP